jgi:hypothetical protein
VNLRVLDGTSRPFGGEETVDRVINQLGKTPPLVEVDLAEHRQDSRFWSQIKDGAAVRFSHRAYPPAIRCTVCRSVTIW